MVEDCVGIRLHHVFPQGKGVIPTMKYGMGLSSLGRGLGLGRPRVSSLRATSKVDLLKMPQSEFDPGDPTFTQRNL